MSLRDPEAVSWPRTFHVKHKEALNAFHVKRWEARAVFHVKPFVKVNKTISLTYTKFPEDHVEQILHIDPPEQPSQ